MKSRILLADDHQMVREALRILLEKETDLEVVAETGDGTQVLGLVRENAVDVVCMDITMPGMNGVEATRRLLTSFPEVKVVGLSAHPDHEYVIDMVHAGALGYVTKSEASTELVRAIRAVLRNKLYLCPDVMDAVSSTLSGSGNGRGNRAPNQLGPRERQVLQLVAEGHSSSEISECLHIAPSTVEVHRRNIMRKLDLHNVAELTRYSIRSGLISA